jgi:menaquinone-dependent protoporphyrinogen IX oxidase
MDWKVVNKMNILVAYTTNSGSTEEVAQAIGQELGKNGDRVDVSRLEQVTGVEAYQAVVVGAPMILGWHRAAGSFLRKHQAALAARKVAYFCTAMSLTQTGEDHIGAVPVGIDPGLAKLPKKPGHLGLKENYALPAHYLQPMLKAAPQIKPVSVGFFGGRLELFKLNFFQMLFVMLVVGAQPGDLRSWSFIQSWSAGLREQFEN